MSASAIPQLALTVKPEKTLYQTVSHNRTTLPSTNTSAKTNSINKQTRHKSKAETRTHRGDHGRKTEKPKTHFLCCSSQRVWSLAAVADLQAAPQRNLSGIFLHRAVNQLESLAHRLGSRKSAEADKIQKL